MTKIMDYNKMIDRSEFIDENQRIIGIFTPVDEKYTELLAQLTVIDSLMRPYESFRLYAQAEKVTEHRLVKNEGKIVGTFEILQRLPLAREFKPCIASPAA